MPVVQSQPGLSRPVTALAANAKIAHECLPLWPIVGIHGVAAQAQLILVGMCLLDAFQAPEILFNDLRALGQQSQVGVGMLVRKDPGGVFAAFASLRPIAAVAGRGGTRGHSLPCQLT